MKLLPLFFLLSTLLISCKPGTPAEHQTVNTTPSVEHPAPEKTLDTSKPAETEVKQAEGSNSEAPAAIPKAHECQPTFQALSKPGNDEYVFYVTGFNAGEFACWEKLEKHGAKLAGDHHTVIYYVDKPDIKLSAGANSTQDKAALKAHGIGRFTYEGKFWEVKGAHLWKRAGSEYSYFNSSNHFGG